MKRNILTGAGPIRVVAGKTLIVLFLLIELYPIAWLILSSFRAPSSSRRTYRTRRRETPSSESPTRRSEASTS